MSKVFQFVLGIFLLALFFAMLVSMVSPRAYAAGFKRFYKWYLTKTRIVHKCWVQSVNWSIDASLPKYIRKKTVFMTPGSDVIEVYGDECYVSNFCGTLKYYSAWGRNILIDFDIDGNIYQTPDLLSKWMKLKREAEGQK